MIFVFFFCPLTGMQNKSKNHAKVMQKNRFIRFGIAIGLA